MVVMIILLVNILNRYNLELDNEFNQRLANTPCDNHCKNIIQIYSSFLFRVKPSRDFGSMAEEPSLESFLKDADLEGNNFNNCNETSSKLCFYLWSLFYDFR